MAAPAISGDQTQSSPVASSILSIPRNITHIKPIPIDLNKAQVEYPLSPRKLNEIRNGLKLNIYVGEPPALDQVFNGFPSKVLCQFCPALRKSLHSVKWAESYIVVFPGLCKSAVGWFLRFALAGGQSVLRKSESKESTEFIHRLHTMLALGFNGQMTKLFWKRLITEVQFATIKWDQIAWLYSGDTSGIIPHYSGLLVREIALGIMQGKIADHKHLQGCRSNKAFYDSMRDIVSTLDEFIDRRQVREKTPLSICQVEFIFAFTTPGEKTRKVLCDGLARLMVDGLVHKGSDYIEFSCHNEDFLQTVSLLGEEYQDHKTFGLRDKYGAGKTNRKEKKFHKRTSTRDSSEKTASVSTTKRTDPEVPRKETEEDILPPEPDNLNVFPALPAIAQPSLQMEESRVPRVSLPLQDRKAQKHDKDVENLQRAAEGEENTAELSKAMLPKVSLHTVYGNRGDASTKPSNELEPSWKSSMGNIPLCKNEDRTTATSTRIKYLSAYSGHSPQLNGKQQLNSVGKFPKSLMSKENSTSGNLGQSTRGIKPVPRVNLPKGDHYHGQLNKDVAPTQRTSAPASVDRLYESVYGSLPAKPISKACQNRVQNPFPRPNVPSATALKPCKSASASQKSSSFTSSGEDGGIPVNTTQTKVSTSDAVQRITQWLERTKLSPSNSKKSAQSSEDSSGGGVDLQKRNPDGSRRVRGKRGGRYKRVWNKETKLWDKVLKGPEDYEPKRYRGAKGSKNPSKPAGKDGSRAKSHVNRGTTSSDKTGRKETLANGGVQIDHNSKSVPITWD